MSAATASNGAGAQASNGGGSGDASAPTAAAEPSLVPYVQVMGFCLADGTGGNAAGLVLPPHSRTLSPAQKQAIAARLGLSETVFMQPAAVVAAKGGGGGAMPAVRLEYFTPEGEVDLCGHATIAAMGHWHSTLRRDGPAAGHGLSVGQLLLRGRGGGSRAGEGGGVGSDGGKIEEGTTAGGGDDDGDVGTVALVAKAGLLSVTFETRRADTDADAAKPGRPLTFMTQNPLTVDAAAVVDRDALAAALGIPTAAIIATPRGLAPCVGSTALRDIMVGVKHGWLPKVRPDMAAITALSDALDTVGIHVWQASSESRTALRLLGGVHDDESGPGSADVASDGAELCVEVRNFAPRFGIDEESATGTSNCALVCRLAPYLARHTLPADAGCREGTVRVRCKQGHLMGEGCQSAILARVRVARSCCVAGAGDAGSGAGGEPKAAAAIAAGSCGCEDCACPFVCVGTPLVGGYASVSFEATVASL